MEKWSLLGSSRGLGREFAKVAASKMRLQLHLSARKKESLEVLKAEVEAFGSKALATRSDFTKLSLQSELLNELQSFAPERIFYFAGGGPYGEYETKEWKDHLWAYELNFLFPARLLFESLKWPSVKQWVVIGSSVAEARPDPKASSYAASKHALVGLISSLAEESSRDLRLFSPGYMNTAMLPPNAKARQLGELVSPQEVAEKLFEWCQQPPSKNFHFTLEPFATRS